MILKEMKIIYDKNPLPYVFPNKNKILGNYHINLNIFWINHFVFLTGVLDFKISSFIIYLKKGIYLLYRKIKNMFNLFIFN